MKVASSDCEFWWGRGKSVLLNDQLPIWFSLFLQLPLVMDSLAHAWTRVHMYSFPLLSLLLLVLARVGENKKASSACRTCFPSHIWLLNLASLLKELHWEIPIRVDQLL